MSISHRTNRLKLVGQPSVEQLQNGRYRLTVNCTALNTRNDWYSANKDRIFPDYGSLQSAEMSIDGLAPREGEAYADMRLTKVESGNRSVRDGGDYLVVLTYETVGSSFVQVKDDNTDYELNGLRRVTRTSIAEAGTDYDETVGSSFIYHQIDDETPVQCYLGSYEINDTDSFRQVEEVWVEAGTLSVAISNLSEGVRQVETTFLAVKGTTVGPIIREETRDFDGLQTISVTTLQDKTGASVIGTGENLVNRYDRLVDFTYPGVVRLREDVITSTEGVDPIIFNFELFTPVQSKVTGTISVIFQSSSDIVASDFIYNDGQTGGAADGFWNPTEWARTYVSGIGWSYSAFSVSKAMRGYRTDIDVSGITSLTPPGQNVFSSDGVVVFQLAGTSYVDPVNSGTGPDLFARINGVSDTNGVLFTIDGRRVFGSTPFIMQVSGGPEDPAGNKYVLDVDVRPAFEDVDGNQYYKKTIITASV